METTKDVVIAGMPYRAVVWGPRSYQTPPCWHNFLAAAKEEREATHGPWTPSIERHTEELNELLKPFNGRLFKIGKTGSLHGGNNRHVGTEEYMLFFPSEKHFTYFALRFS